MESSKIEQVKTALKDRLSLGRKRYGHGVRIYDDTTQFGTPSDSWFQMMNEEILDGMIYCACAYLRENDATATEPDDNDQVLNWIQTILNSEKIPNDDRHMRILKNLYECFLLSC